jgi:Tfp pilus assembly protein PilP
MRTGSRRTLWVLLAGAVVTGWCSASIVAPPSAGTQTLPARRTPAAGVAVIPPIPLALTVPRTAPTGQRNPFAFGTTRAAVAAGTSGARGADDIAPPPAEAFVPTAAPALPDLDQGWRLIGFATEAAGRTAILAGPDGVVFVRLGDRLANGRTVLDLTETTVTLGRESSPPLVLRLP